MKYKLKDKVRIRDGSVHYRQGVSGNGEKLTGIITSNTNDNSNYDQDECCIYKVDWINGGSNSYRKKDIELIAPAVKRPRRKLRL